METFPGYGGQRMARRHELVTYDEGEKNHMKPQNASRSQQKYCDLKKGLSSI